VWNPERKQKVMIIDDEPTNIKILSKIVEPYGDVLFALNGKTALNLILNESPDLILLDIVMPEMDGYELIVKLKNDPLTEKIPVIFVTEKREENEEIRGLELGAIDYITKPLSAPMVAARVKNHLELKRSRDLLETLSTLDGLTGIPNRRSFDVTLENEWKKAMRTKSPLAMIMADVDFFKNFNDEFGHLAGDDVLRAIAGFLFSSAARASDFTARYGGEEFAVILPGLSLKKAYIFAVKLKNNLQEYRNMNTALSKYRPVTLSFGIASDIPVPGKQPDELILAADKMLYSAKLSGRNCIRPNLS